MCMDGKGLKEIVGGWMVGMKERRESRERVKRVLRKTVADGEMGVQEENALSVRMLSTTQRETRRRECSLFGPSE